MTAMESTMVFPLMILLPLRSMIPDMAHPDGIRISPSFFNIVFSFLCEFFSPSNLRVLIPLWQKKKRPHPNPECLQDKTKPINPVVDRPHLQISAFLNVNAFVHKSIHYSVILTGPSPAFQVRFLL